MGKHLSVKEKENAEEEYVENKAKIKQLRKRKNFLMYLTGKLYARPYWTAIWEQIDKIKDEIVLLQKRNEKLNTFIRDRRRSIYKSQFTKYGLCYMKFGKKLSELTKAERSEYNKIMKQRYRKRMKGADMETKDRETILDLYFNKVRMIDDIVEYFQGKYSASEIRNVVYPVIEGEKNEA